MGDLGRRKPMKQAGTIEERRVKQNNEMFIPEYKNIRSTRMFIVYYIREFLLRHSNLCESTMDG